MDTRYEQLWKPGGTVGKPTRVGGIDLHTTKISKHTVTHAP